MLRGNQMRDTVRDGFGLAAPRSGENQHRAFGCRYCFLLLGIETREEIHYFGIFAS